MNAVTAYEEKKKDYWLIHDSFAKHFEETVFQAYADYGANYNVFGVPEFFTSDEDFFDAFCEVHQIAEQSVLLKMFGKEAGDPVTEEEMELADEEFCTYYDQFEDAIFRDMSSLLREKQIFFAEFEFRPTSFESVERISNIVNSPLQKVW